MSESDLPLAPAQLRVLLLDDDVFMLELLQQMLAELGPYEVFCHSDGQSALSSLVSAAPHLLVCDLSMPNMDGIEFMQAAAESGFDGGVMLLSGLDPIVRKAAERLARAHGLRVLGAWRKPISAEQLRGALAPVAAGQLPPRGEAPMY